MTTHLFDDLYRYNDWANARILRLCEGLTAEQLDATRAMGFGSLRATLFHMLAAERIWLERWKGVPWRPFDTDPAGMQLDEISARLRDAAQARRELVDCERSSNWKRIVGYRDGKGNPFRNALDELLMHVANHGTHHRAQVLNFLKTYGRTVPGGLDYIFYRMARPTVSQDPSEADLMRQYGLEINTAPGVELAWDAERVQKYFDYQDWATTQLFSSAQALGDADLDRTFDMGPGSIRKIFLHLMDAENWWLKNWTIGPSEYAVSPADTSLDLIRENLRSTMARRNEFLQKLNENEAARIVTVRTGGPTVNVQISESLVQLCCHGTHHRAQAVNMLRQCGVTAPQLDIVFMTRVAIAAGE